MLKLLRENIGNILQDFELDKNFLKRTSVAEKLTLEKWMLHRIGGKNSFPGKFRQRPTEFTKN